MINYGSLRMSGKEEETGMKRNVTENMNRMKNRIHVV
jgi:hypothetical protein